MFPNECNIVKVTNGVCDNVQVETTTLVLEQTMSSLPVKHLVIEHQETVSSQSVSKISIPSLPPPSPPLTAPQYYHPIPSTARQRPVSKDPQHHVSVIKYDPSADE